MTAATHESAHIQSKGITEQLSIPEFDLRSNKELSQFTLNIHECSERLKACSKSDIISTFNEYINSYNIKTDDEFILYILEQFNVNNAFVELIINFVSNLIYKFKEDYSGNIFESPDIVFSFITKLSDSLKTINTPIHIDNNIHHIYDNKVFAKLNELYCSANYNYVEEQEQQQTQEEKDLFNRYLSNYNCKEVNLIDLINIIIDIEKYSMLSIVHRRLQSHLETKVKNMLIIKNLFNAVTIMMSGDNISVYTSSIDMYKRLSNVICSNLLIYDNIKNNNFTFQDERVKQKFVEFKNNITNNITKNIYQLIYLYTTYCMREHIDPRTWSLSGYLKELLIWNTECINEESKKGINSCCYINVFNNYIYLSNSDTFDLTLR